MTAEPQVSSSSHTLILYDGVCGLCNWLVAFVIRHDRRDHFRFAPLQGVIAGKLLRGYDLNPADLDTVVVLAGYQQPSERVLTRSQAVLWCVERLGGMWRVFAAAKVLPLPFRETLYRSIARRRYRIFGKYDTCPLPRPEDHPKFLGSQ